MGLWHFNAESHMDSDITIVHEWIFRAISSMKVENKCESLTIIQT